MLPPDTTDAAPITAATTSNPTARSIVPVSLTYEFGPGSEAGFGNRFFDTLAAVRDERSVAAAARHLGVSYRHLWGYLKEREEWLGRALIVWEKGRAAKLTDFAQRLLWSEAQIKARLAGKIEALATEISRELTAAFDESIPVARCIVSHDLALPMLNRLCREQDRLLLDVSYEGSIDALRALRDERCDYAGIHLPLGTPHLAARGTNVHEAFGPLLRLGREKLITVAWRTQGIMTAAGNPHGIHSLADLSRVRFINRQPDSGTRALLDTLTHEAGVPTGTIDGYDRAEPTHLAAAAAVAAGQVDATFGIEAAAAHFGLFFVPVVREQYFLVCRADTIDTPNTAVVIEALCSASWRQALDALPGYSAEGAGEVVSLRRTLPWYQ